MQAAGVRLTSRSRLAGAIASSCIAVYFSICPDLGFLCKTSAEVTKLYINREFLGVLTGGGASGIKQCRRFSLQKKLGFLLVFASYQALPGNAGAEALPPFTSPLIAEIGL